MAEIESIIGFSVKTFLSSSFFTASDSATNAPEILAVLVPPSA